MSKATNIPLEGIPMPDTTKSLTMMQRLVLMVVHELCWAGRGLDYDELQRITGASLRTLKLTAASLVNSGLLVRVRDLWNCSGSYLPYCLPARVTKVPVAIDEAFAAHLAFLGRGRSPRDKYRALTAPTDPRTDPWVPLTLPVEESTDPDLDAVLDAVIAQQSTNEGRSNEHGAQHRRRGAGVPAEHVLQLRASPLGVRVGGLPCALQAW